MVSWLTGLALDEYSTDKKRKICFVFQVNSSVKSALKSTTRRACKTPALSHRLTATVCQHLQQQDNVHLPDR